MCRAGDLVWPANPSHPSFPRAGTTKRLLATPIPKFPPQCKRRNAVEGAETEFFCSKYEQTRDPKRQQETLRGRRGPSRSAREENARFVVADEGSGARGGHRGVNPTRLQRRAHLAGTAPRNPASPRHPPPETVPQRHNSPLFIWCFPSSLLRRVRGDPLINSSKTSNKVSTLYSRLP